MISDATTIAELAEILRRNAAGLSMRAQWNPEEFHAEARVGSNRVVLSEAKNLAAAKAGAR